MMVKKLVLLVGMCMVVACASSAFAAVTLKRLGDHPFYRPAMTSEADLRTMVEKNNAELQEGFAQAGNPELFPAFMEQFPTAKVETVQVARGERMDWMLFKQKGTNRVKAIKDVTWDGEEAFDAFSFHIDQDGKRYQFIVPAACGNLSLRAVSTVETVTAVNKEPVCAMVVSSKEVKCGQTITVDATGSQDSDGTISEVVFQVVDASNQVVVEKRVKQAPFVQKLTIPCESSQYTVKAVVIDNTGAQSNPADCTQTMMIAKRKGGPVFDIGYAHQFDPADYVFGRVGYEYPLADNLYVMGLVGGFALIDHEDDIRFPEHDAESAFTADALLNYYLTEKLYVGGGVGVWSGNDGKVDLIVDLGYLVYEKPGVMKTSLFVEGRCYADELVSSWATRLGAGLRFEF